MRLSDTSLPALGPDLTASNYDRQQACGVVHLGTGAFHRGHQADYFDQLMQLGEDGWMIQGASLRRPTAAEQLNPQDGIYTLAVRSGERVSRRIIRSIKNVMVAPDDPAALIDALANPSVALVTLTITEKGYCLDPASGNLLSDDAAVKWDLKHHEAPKTAPGFIVAGLAKRRRAALPPFTVLSCDNIPENGVRTRRAVLQFAQRLDIALADWIAAEVSFPSSMVDRIVPATTEDDRNNLNSECGYSDQAMVKTEPFSQWVIEDNFCNRRPDLDRVGVQFTSDVGPYEKVKLRLLNAAHSALAYLGPLAGHEFVHDAMNGEGFEHLIEALWDEATTTLEPIEDFGLADYRSALKQRFKNAALAHRTRQIAIDGSQKVPQRFLNSVRERRKKGLTSPALSLALAGWIRWQLGEDEAGINYTVEDPLAGQTSAILAQHRDDPAALIRATVAFEPVFGYSLKQDRAFVSEVERAFVTLLNKGAAQAVKEMMSC